MKVSTRGRACTLRSLARTALLAATALSVTACASTDAAEDRYQLVVTAPGLESTRPEVTRRTIEAQVVERSRWRPENAQWPRADMTFWRISDTFRGTMAYGYRDTMPDLIRAYLPGEWITVGAGGQAQNVLGTVDYQRFRWKFDIECIFVRQGVDRFSGLVSLTGSGEFLGDMVIKGWYCVGPDSGTRDAQFRAFIRGIGIRGWALP